MPWSTQTIRVMYRAAIGPNLHNFTGIEKKVDFADYEELITIHNSPDRIVELENHGSVTREDIH